MMSEPAFLNTIDKNDFKTAFKISGIWQLFNNNPGNWLLVTLLAPLLGILLSPFDFLACLIGIFFIIPLVSAIVGHLEGQAYFRSKQKLQQREDTPEQLK